MAIGRAYPQDNKIVDADLFLGTKSSSLATVNYTAQSVADYLNNQGKISIGGQTTFKFVVVNPVIGTISFPNGGGDNTDFSLVTNLIVSIIDMSNQNVVDFIDYIIGSEILLTEQNQVSIFGNYKIITYSVTSNPNFYDLSLEYIGGYGSLHKDLYYDLSFFRDSIVPPPAPIPSLNEVLSVGNVSLLDAKIGELYLYDTSNQDYGKIQLSDSEYNFYNTSGDIISTISNIGAIFRASLYYGFLNVPTTLTANRTYEFPNASGTIALTSDLTPYLLSTTATSTYYPIPTGTISQYIRGDGTFATFPTIPTVGTWGTLNYPAWTTGTPFVKMTAVGTFALDTNTYLTGITSSDVTTALGYTPANASGTTNYLPKFTGASALGNSLIFDNGTNVGIGTAAPAVALDIYGTGTVQSRIVSASGGDIRFSVDTLGRMGTYSNSSLALLTNSVSRLLIDTAGNVGIGTSTPSSKLQVNAPGALSTDIAFKIRNSADTADILKVNGAGLIESINVGTSLQLLNTAGVGVQFLNGSGSTSYSIRGWNVNSGAYSPLNINSSPLNLNTLSNANVIFGSGNVGIGTTAPTSKFQSNNVSTYNSTTPSGAIIASNLSNGNAIVDIGVDSALLGYIQSRNITSTTSYNLLLNPIGGNVGIGTTAPAYKLDVNGTVKVGHLLQMIEAPSTYGAKTIIALRDATPDPATQYFNGLTFANSSGFLDVSSSSTLNLSYTYGFAVASKVWGGASYALTNRLYINSSGNVGIGTTAPTNAKLKVSGNSASGAIMSEDTTSTTSFVRVLGDISSQNLFNWQSGTALRFATSNQDYSSFAERMRITNAGNVGIGTTAPAEKLSIAGNIELTVGVNRYVKIGSATNYFYNLQSVNDNFQILEAGTTPRLTITYPNGNVGIGTTAPAFLLEVNGTGRFTGNLSLSQPASLLFANGQTIKDNGSAGLAINIGAGQVFSVIVPTVLIGTTTNIASSKLTVESTTQGFLPPRMTNAQRIAIATPAVGLCVYCTDVVEGLYINKSTGWTYIG